MDQIVSYAKYLFKEKPILGYGFLGLILWLAIDFFLGLILFSIGLYITFRRQDAERIISNSTKKCSQCQMEIPFLAKKCPHCQSKLKTPLSAGGKMIAFLAIVAIVVSIVVASNANTVPQQQDTYIPPLREVEMVFDIPSLLEKSLSQLETELGTTTNDVPPTDTYLQFSEIRTWEMSWHKSGYFLMVTYNIDTEEIIDLFLGTATDATLATFRDTNNILKVGNLVINSPDYSVEFVELRAILGQPKLSTTEGYTGAIITTK